MGIRIFKDAACTIRYEGKYIDNITGLDTMSPTDANGTANADNPNYLPIETEHPIAGSSVTVQTYMKNDNAQKYYTNATADPVGSDESFVQLSLDNVTFATAGASINLADFGSKGTPDTAVRNLWIKVTTPVESDSQNRQNVNVTIAGREYAV